MLRILNTILNDSFAHFRFFRDKSLHKTDLFQTSLTLANLFSITEKILKLLR